MRHSTALGIALLVPLACATPDQPPGAFDLLISGGTLIDGTGSPGRPADVLVRDGRITHVGAVDLDTLEAGVADVFDATDLVVAPGFIDAHAHGDPTDPEDAGFANFLAMGVTALGSPSARIAPEDCSRPRRGARHGAPRSDGPSAGRGGRGHR